MNNSSYNETDRVLLVRIDERLEHLTERVGQLEKDVKDVRSQANRWKGAFIAILALSSFIGWVISQLDKIKNFLS